MIKPSQIREKEFASSTMGGYKKSDVDSFLDDVAVSYEQLYKENSELLKKLRLLVDNIEEYRKREQDGDGAYADNAIAEAEAQAAQIIADARAEADRIVAGAQECAAEQSDDARSVSELKKLRQQEEAALANIRAESEKFRKSLLAMYTEHLSLIQSMVGSAPAKKADKSVKTYETKLDVAGMEVDEKFAMDDIDSFFDDALTSERGRIKEAFGGFRFEMGSNKADDTKVTEPEEISDFEEPAAEEQNEIHSELTVELPPGEQEEADEPQSDSEEIKPGFKISFPEDEETGEEDEENLDDLFAGFFNPTDKPER